MLSALIPSERGYPVVDLAAQPVCQRFVRPGPLVLRPALLKLPTPTTSRHRGAKPLRRFELLGAISLLSPEYLLSYERRTYHKDPPDHFALLSHLIDLWVSQSSPLLPMHSRRGCHSRRADLWKPPLRFWRRPPQSNYPPSGVPITWLDPGRGKGGISTCDSTRARAPTSQSPTYPTHPTSRISAKL